MAKFKCYECNELIESTDDLTEENDLVYDGKSWYKLALCPHCGIASWLIPTGADPMNPKHSDD